ncbi:SMP-30/gluconolactonase/LRE family protein [Chryseolinea sp. H1M3-3]|uniref:SMP-30/gluconolactonase/LRE family protein n=1 Tax=Chryseolinea sp. H1M3-3 TaxID=3034144 RepID=UPI0023EB9B77|nr:SMP-30/gluconolactonase/LRE family protein [Chryseolinea sp. H1M3-3]
MKYLIACALLIASFSCTKKEQQAETETQEETKSIGTIERIDPDLDAIVKADAAVEIIAEGFEWSEGPLWIEEQKALLFSDVPANTVYKWTEEKGKETYLTPSGRTGTLPYGDEPGSNGLTLNSEGKLVLCQHGDRRVAIMDAPLSAPEPKFISLADNFNGKKLNSPNDAVFNSKGELFITDPPYGLPKKADDPTKETPFHGVYKQSNGQLKLLTDSITRPNGIALFPEEKTLIVANSDPEKAKWYAFDLAENDMLTNARIFYDASENAKTEKGLPDGLKIDKQGNVFATGPGGVWIFNRDAKLLGRIKISELTSNCALSPDEKTLYVTADMYVVRIKLRD